MAAVLICLINFYDLGDQELSKGYKFIKRVLSNFAANNGIRLNVDDETGVQIEEIEEEGIFKIRFRFDLFLWTRKKKIKLNRSRKETLKTQEKEEVEDFVLNHRFNQTIPH